MGVQIEMRIMASGSGVRRFEKGSIGKTSSGVIHAAGVIQCMPELWIFPSGADREAMTGTNLQVIYQAWQAFGNAAVFWLQEDSTAGAA